MPSHIKQIAFLLLNCVCAQAVYAMSFDESKLKCMELGFVPNTEKYGSCVLTLYKASSEGDEANEAKRRAERREARLQEEAAEARRNKQIEEIRAASERAARQNANLKMMEIGFGMMRGPTPPPPPTTCISQPNGNTGSMFLHCQ